MSKCIFNIAWVGRCDKPTTEHTLFCEQHADKKCVVCGNQASKDCGIATSLVCGMPLCDSYVCYIKHKDSHNLSSK